MANINSWSIKDGIRLARTVGKELDDPARYTTEEFISAAERALRKYPNEWVIYFSLADKYQDLGYYAEALKLTQKCVDLRPNDIRSVYALATSYNILTRAVWSDKENELANVLRLLVDSDKLDKRYSQAGLDHIGLAVETAAVQAIRWFEHALKMNPDNASKNQIYQDLSTLYKRFPNLRR